MKLIQVNPEDIKIIADDAGKFLFKPEAEESFSRLLELQDLINTTVENVLKGIKDAGESINEDFKGVKGEHISISKRKFGNRYTFKMRDVDKLKPYLKEVSYNTVDAEAVDKYVDALGELPDGILEKDREDKMVIRRKDEEDSSQLQLN